MFEKLGKWIWRLLLVYIALLVVESAACVAIIVALSGPADADLTDAQTTAASSGLLTMQYAGYAQVVVYIALVVLFLRLLYKAVQQAKSFSTPFTYVSPGWAVGYWFVPVMNLYRPFQVVKALFAACTHEAGPGAKSAVGEQLLGAWWAMLLIGNMASWALARSDIDMSSRAGVTSFVGYDIACNLLLIVGAVLFSLVVKHLVRAMGIISTAKTVPGG